MQDKTKFYDYILTQVNDPKLFHARNDIFITEIGEGIAKGRMEDTGKTRNRHGTHHGGALTTMMDTLSGAVLASLGKKAVTVHDNVNYLHMAQGTIYGEAKVRKPGSTIYICDARLWNEAGKEVAIGTFSFFVIGELSMEEMTQEENK